MIKKVLILAFLFSIVFGSRASAYEINPDIGCHELEVVYARGSGAEQDMSKEFNMVINAAMDISSKYSKTLVVSDLHYEAVGVSTPGHLLGAYISAGKAYAFGRSVRGGVENMKEYYRERNAMCPDEKWILVGYSQGAMVMSQALEAFNEDSLLFVMLLGDPNTYLPEGAGLFPSACRGGKLSEWRTYAPNCYTHKGVFGGREPYELAKFSGRYSLWCNRNDYICGSSKNPFINSGHSSYEELGEIKWGMTYLAKKYLGAVNNSRNSLKMRSLAADLETVDDDGFESLINSTDNKASSAVDVDMPSGVKALRDEDKLYLYWNNAPDYVLLRLNGVDLGYVDGVLGEAVIVDMEPEGENRLEVFGMSEAGDLSDMIALDVNDNDVGVMLSGADFGVENSLGNNLGQNAALPESVEWPIVATETDNDGGVNVAAEQETTPLEDDFGLVTSRSVIPRAKASSGTKLSFDQKSNIVGVILSVFGATGLLVAFMIRRRRGE